MKKISVLLMMIFTIAACSGMAEAGLTQIGTATYNGKSYNLIYEEDQGIVWLDYTDRNAGGWVNAMNWVSGLNEPGVLTYTLNPETRVTWRGDWRLPETVDRKRSFGYDGQTTAGFNITSSEMGHLYYTSLGNSGYFDVNGNVRTGWGLKETGLFTNLYPEHYWSSTEYSIYDQHAWMFDIGSGAQSNGSVKSTNCVSAVAVRPCAVDIK